MKNKIKLSSELMYFAHIIILSFAVAMASAANLGLSMIASPAFILSQKLTFLTFGLSEYVIQTILFIVFCFVMKRFKPIFLSSYITCLIYGAALDIWRKIIPAFNPEITPPGSFPLVTRIIMFSVSVIMTAIAIALCYRTYLYPQVYDFFVKGVAEHYNLNQTTFKSIFDASFFCLSLILTFAFFGSLVGIGIGTVIITVVNGPLIGLFGKIYDKFFVSVPTFKRFSALFSLE